MIRFCNKRTNHVCLGLANGTAHECDGGCIRERGVDQAPYKLEPPEKTIGQQMQAAHEQLQQEGALETPADIVAAEVGDRRGSSLRVLKGDEQPLTHADTAPTRTAQVIRWAGVTRHDLPVDRVLEGAADCKAVVVLGYKPDGSEFFAASIADGADVLWLLERLKLQLLTTGAETDAV